MNRRPEESPASGSSTSSRQVKRKETPWWQSYSLRDSIACRFVQFHSASCLWKYSQQVQCKKYTVLLFCQTYEFAKKKYVVLSDNPEIQKIALIRYHLLDSLCKAKVSVNEWNCLSKFRKEIFWEGVVEPGGGCQKILIMLRKYVLVYKKIMIETDLVLSECRKGMFKSVHLSLLYKKIH